MRLSGFVTLMTAAAPPAVESSLQAHKAIEIEALPMAMDETRISGSGTNSTGTNCPLKHGAEDRDKLSHTSVERASIRSVIRSVRFWILARSGGSRRTGGCHLPTNSVDTTVSSPHWRRLTLHLAFFTRRKRPTVAPMGIRQSSATGSSAQSLWWGP